MKHIYIIFFLLTTFISSQLNAQSCVEASFADGSAPPGTTSISMACGGGTANMSATFNGSGTVGTSLYNVSSIPFSFTGFTGTTIPITTDDIWSSTISIPFNFCFFGVSYNQLIIGSNGIISFDVSTAGGFCPWTISAGIPSTSYPRASIMGVYNDIDPRFGAPTRRIQYIVSGTSPCRQLIVSFEDIAYYSSTCSGTNANYQIILNETSNIIDVQIQNHNGCSSTNSGKGIVGIQDFNRTAAFSVPGRNAVTFSTTNEAWRFTPIDTNNIFRHMIVHLFENGTLVDSTVPYYAPFPTLRADFTRSITFPPDSHLFHIELMVYDSTTLTGSGTGLCSYTGGLYTFNDLLYYNAGSLHLTNSITNVNCYGESNGSIDITAITSSPPVSYSWSDGATSEDRTGLSAGTYTVSASDLGGCTIVSIFEITEPDMLMIMLDSIKHVDCAGSATGSIDITTMGGTMPYFHNWTGGYGSEDIFGLTAGLYDIMVIDSHGCIANESYVVLPGTLDTSTLYFTRCNGDSILLGGSWRFVGGTYYDTLNNSHGCDSIITNILTILPNATLTLNPSICLGSSYTFNGTTYTSSGTYYDTLSSYLGCDSIITINLSINSPSTYTQNINGCTGDIFFLGGMNQTTSGTYYDTLTNSNGCDSILTSNLTINSLSTTSEIYSVCFGTNMFGFYVFEDTIIDNHYLNVNGCDSTNSVIINVLPLPIANAGTDQSINIGDSAILNASGGTYYNWNTGSNTALTVVAPSITTTYFVMVISADSCSSIDSVIVEVQNPSKGLVLPDAFTPNGDNLNDKFLPINISSFNINSFIIFNRWGEAVYNVNNNTDGWDGKFNAADQPIGTYVYYIKGTAISDGAESIIQGIVTLVR